mmetsp:Transcript_45965/g.56411  ORF Transcript_45965/g.56411 Transcript_45965/m.56411 type:complete len:104 (+) Transcript_45965:375-686(+)
MSSMTMTASPGTLLVPAIGHRLVLQALCRLSMLEVAMSQLEKHPKGQTGLALSLKASNKCNVGLQLCLTAVFHRKCNSLDVLPSLQLKTGAAGSWKKIVPRCT